MDFIQLSIRQPITIAVGIILAVLAGLIALQRVPVQMTPEVNDTVIAATTRWENASPQEVETEVIDEQEEKLQGISGLVSMTSTSQAGQGQIRLQFLTGTDKSVAMAEVSEKLRQVPEYPDGVDEPEITETDPDSVDYIAWIGLSASDPDFDPTTLYDFMDKRMKPRFERVPGISEVGMVGAREREVQIRIDPAALAQRGITLTQLREALAMTNDNWSGGSVAEGKSDIRLRAVGRFATVDQVRDTVIRRDPSGPIYVKDIADVQETYKEMVNWVRTRGHYVPFFNFQREQGANLIEVMTALKAEVAAMNAPGGLLEQEAKRLGLNGGLELVQAYDQTTYVQQAIDLVEGNIYVGGALAVLSLLLFLRSVRAIGIIAIAIPISVIASIVVLVAMGRSINIVSLAGIAFATGMVVDNAIVVLENIYRHLDMGKGVAKAAYDGTREVYGAVIASTLTTLIVFVPILLIQESAGQLFRDIALAICASVGLSMIVALTVIPSAAAKLLRKPKPAADPVMKAAAERNGSRGSRLMRPIHAAGAALHHLPQFIGAMVHRITRGVMVRTAVILFFIAGTFIGIWMLMPPLDYLPKGNRNVVFGVLIPPPGYNMEQLSEVGRRMEERIRPSWEATEPKFEIERVVAKRDGRPVMQDLREPVPMMPMPGSPMVMPPPLDHYFLVAMEGMVFHGAISADEKRVVDAIPLLNHSTSDAAAPGVISFAFQFPLFQMGGQSGSAINIDLAGADLEQVNAGALALLGGLIERFGPYSTQPEPSNFMLPSPEMQVIPDDARLSEMGMTRRDVGYAVQANGDGLFVGEYEVEGELKDLKIISERALTKEPLANFGDIPLATPGGRVVPLSSVATINRVGEPKLIKRVGRQRAVTLQFTAPTGVPLGAAIDEVNGLVANLREGGAIPAGVDVNLAGTAGKLAEIKVALLGDGSFVGLMSSSLFLALLMVYLLMVVLFQSWTYPFVIMLTVPLATFGGFLGLAAVHAWSVYDRYLPVQNMDVLTILGFVILAGTVVNNAILIVHQALNFLREGDEQGRPMTPRDAIRASVSSRVRPIMMTTVTTVGGMLPLVLMPGSGSELYRGLGSVVVGGMIVSTIFTLVLVPVVLSVVFDLKARAGTVLPAEASLA